MLPPLLAMVTVLVISTGAASGPGKLLAVWALTTTCAVSPRFIAPSVQVTLPPQLPPVVQLPRLALALTICCSGGTHQFGGRGDVRSKSMAVQRRFNAASVLAGGQVVGTYCKRELPNYQVFDERRYFISGRDAGLPPLVFEVAGLRFGVLICEDAWFEEPAPGAPASPHLFDHS